LNDSPEDLKKFEIFFHKWKIRFFRNWTPKHNEKLWKANKMWRAFREHKKVGRPKKEKRPRGRPKKLGYDD